MFFKGIMKSDPTIKGDAYRANVLIDAFIVGSQDLKYATIKDVLFMLPPGLSVTGFKTDDAVYVGFVENDYTKPVILGKMVTKETETLKAGNIQAEAVTAETLSITDTAAINKLNVKEKLEYPNSFFTEIKQKLNIEETINGKLKNQMATVKNMINQSKMDMDEIDEHIKQKLEEQQKVNTTVNKDPANTVAETTNQNNRFNEKNKAPKYGRTISTKVTIKKIKGAAVVDPETVNLSSEIVKYTGKRVGTFLDKNLYAVEYEIDMSSINNKLTGATRYEINIPISINSTLVKIDINNTFLKTNKYVFQANSLNAATDTETYQHSCHIDLGEKKLMTNIAIWTSNTSTFNPDKLEKLYITYEYTAS